MSTNTITIIDPQPTQTLSDPQPWNRMPDEPAMWYSRFISHFLPMGPTRSILGAYKSYISSLYPNRPIPIVPPAPWHTNSKLYHWRTRAEAHDAVQWQQVQQDYDLMCEQINQECINAARTVLNKALTGIATIDLDDKPATVKDIGPLSVAVKGMVRELRESTTPATQSLTQVNIILQALPDSARDLILAALESAKK